MDGWIEEINLLTWINNSCLFLTGGIFFSPFPTALPPSTVVNVTAKALSATEIHVHWKPPERGSVTRYQIRYWRPGKRDKQSAWLTAPTTDYIAGSLKKFSNYRFEIIPYSEEVIGEGYVIFAETLPSVPDDPPSNVAMKTMNATVRRSWQQNGISKFEYSS